MNTQEKRISPRKGIKRGMALSRTSVERWINGYLDSGQDIRALADETDQAGAPGVKRLDVDQDTIIASVLDECEKKRQYRTTDAIKDMVINRIALENRTRPQNLKLSLPGKTTVYRRIHERGAESILRRRRSRTEQKAHDPVDAGPEVTRIMERVEFDGTGVPLFVVDEEDRLPIGALMISYALDKFSSYPLGFYYGFEPLGYASTMSCALHAFSPKRDTRQLYGTENLWLARGLPELAVIDNGPEYLNRHMMESLGMLGVLVDQCPVNSPWIKASVERFIKTTKVSLAYQMPGSFTSILELAECDPSKYACISKNAVVQIMHIFFLDYYAQRWHEGVHGVPTKLWMKSEEKEGFIPTFPSSLEELQVLLFRDETRTLQREGIEYEKIFYKGTDGIRLRSLLAHEDRKVTIRVNPYDLSYIYVLDPITNAEWLKFPAADKPGYTRGLSLWKHLFLKNLVNQEKREVDVFSLAEAKARIQRVVDEEYRTTKNRKARKAAARYRSKNPLLPASMPSVVSSQGMSLAPKLLSPVVESEKQATTQVENTEAVQESKDDTLKPESTPSIPITPATSSVPEEIRLDDSKWSSDYGLPQRGTHR